MQELHDVAHMLAALQTPQHCKIPVALINLPKGLGILRANLARPLHGFDLSLPGPVKKISASTGNYYSIIGVYIGIMEKKMEATVFGFTTTLAGFCKGRWFGMFAGAWPPENQGPASRPRHPANAPPKVASI